MEDQELHNVRVNPMYPTENPSSIRMRQESELFRQTVIRYDEKEIPDLVKNEDTPDDQKWSVPTQHYLFKRFSLYQLRVREGLR